MKYQNVLYRRHSLEKEKKKRKEKTPFLAVPRNVWVEFRLEKLLLPGAWVEIHPLCPFHGSQTFVILCE